MKDFEGNDLKIGDTVVYAKKYGNHSVRLERSQITGFKLVSGIEYAIIPGNWDRGISSQKIKKV